MTVRNVAEDNERLTRGEAAATLRVSISTIDRYLRDGTLPKTRLGKRLVRINRSDILALLSPESTPTTPSSDVRNLQRPGEGVTSIS